MVVAVGEREREREKWEGRGGTRLKRERVVVEGKGV